MEKIIFSPRPYWEKIKTVRNLADEKLLSIQVPTLVKMVKATKYCNMLRVPFGQRVNNGVNASIYCFAVTESRGPHFIAEVRCGRYVKSWVVPAYDFLQPGDYHDTVLCWLLSGESSHTELTFTPRNKARAIRSLLLAYLAVREVESQRKRG